MVIEEETVTKVAPSDEVVAEYPPESAETAVEADENCVLPGFVEATTHALFAGDRSDEFEARLSGKSYHYEL